MEKYDKIIIGAGLYGLYSALFLAQKGQHVLVLECDDKPFKRATYINQARVHQGYHYPRSLSTALKSAGYFERFSRDYSFCINKEFDQIYATSDKFSWTDGVQFRDFCKAACIPCEELSPDIYFNKGMCNGAFKTREYTYDAAILRDQFIDNLDKYPNNVSILYDRVITEINRTNDDTYEIRTENEEKYETSYIINATYAGTNHILDLIGYEKFNIKYELCEVILCDVGDKLKSTGITVMDGPFFSIMPFGMTDYHSLTSVTFTPHTTSYDPIPKFSCQNSENGICSDGRLGNCNDCPAHPPTSYPYMANLAGKYLKSDYKFDYRKSLYSMKPILMSSEIDDSRPTIIRIHSQNPTFISILSGKINTVYDLDEVLEND